MPLASGARLGPYEIQAAIGAGGMGEVYRARDTRLDRTVAIKVLPTELSADPERRTRFEREARAVAALNHPHICTLHDIGTHDGATYLVMEHLPGPTLAERLGKGPLPLAQALDIAAQIADALDAAHKDGIIHRDLKPGNVMLTKTGAKLLDFGLAKLKGHGAEPAAAQLASAATRSAPLTAEGTIVGTLQYMAPEQVEGKPADARTDLWALGAILYEMLTGKRAFEGTSAASLIGNILNTEPPAIVALQPVAPPALDRLVRRCLAKDPDARWQNAADVADAVRGISTDWVAAPSVRAPQLPARRRLTLAAGAAVVLFVVAALVWAAFSQWSSRSTVASHADLSMTGGTELRRAAFGVIAAAADGSGVVYLGGTSGGQGQFFWHDLRGPESWALAGTEGVTTPFLSPDGRWLGFHLKGKLLKLPLQAGRVAEGSPATELAAVDQVRGASWGPDGTIVYAQLGGGLWKVAAGGGQPQALTKPDWSRKEFGHAWPIVLPGGRQVLFTILHASGRSERCAIAVLSLDTLRVTKVIDGGAYARYLPSGHLVFGRDSTVLAVPFDLKALKPVGSPTPVLNDVWFWSGSKSTGFDVAGDGTLVYATWKAVPPDNTLLWVTRDGEVEQAVPERQPYGFAAVSPDGQRLAAVIEGAPYASLAIYDLRDKRWQRLNVEADCGWPVVWSPTGDRLVFDSNLDGPSNLYVISADGDSPPVRLATSRNMQLPWSWSKDGRFIAYNEQTGPVLQIYVVPAGGVAKPARWGPDIAVVPAFSPDGRWLAYQSSESGRFEAWARPFPGPGQKQAVSGRDGGYAPVWSSDGSEMFYIERLRDTRIMSRRVESLSPLRLGAPRVAFALPFTFDFEWMFSRMFSVAPDGRRVLVVQPDNRAPEVIRALHVIRNWPEDVKTRLSAR